MTDETEAIETVEPTIEETMNEVFDRVTAEEAPAPAKDESEDTEIEAQDDSGEAPANETPPEGDEESEPSEAIAAPNSWTDEEKAEFEKLTPEAQKATARRESDRDKALTSKTQEIADERKRYEALATPMERLESHARQAGVPIDQAMSALVAAHERLLRDPEGAIRELAARYGANPQTAQGEEPEFVDPDIASVRQENAALKTRLDAIENGQTQTANAQVQTTINDFSTAKTEAGELAHPHFEAVKDMMGVLMGAGKDMQRAYDDAVKIDPVLGQAQLDARQKEATAAADAKTKERAAKARKAGKTNLPKSGQPSTGKVETPEQTMSRIYDEVSAA